MEFAQRSDLYYAIQSKKKMDELLEELKKYEFIGYKFLEKYKNYYWLTLSPKIAAPTLTNVAPCSIADL